MYVERDLECLTKDNSSAAEAHTVQYTINGLNAEVYVYDGVGNILTNLLDLEESLPHDYKKVINQKHVFEYDDAYLDSTHGRIKIKSIQFIYDILNISEELVIDADDIVKAIIKDVKSGDI